MPNRRPPRINGFDYLGRFRYFVTCCVLQRREVFTAAAIVHGVRDQILRTCTDCGFEEIASVYMPDHFHGLFDGLSDDSAFKPFMKLMRQRTALAYRALDGCQLWQDGYYDHVLREEEDTRAVASYILANPVRKGLVESIEDYPFAFCKYGCACEGA